MGSHIVLNMVLYGLMM